MTKRLLCFSLIITLVFALCACGGGSDDVYYTVSFDTDGGTPVLSQTVKAGEPATVPEKPLKNGYSFVGWTLDGAEYGFTDAVNADITLVAVYKLQLKYEDLIGFWSGDGFELSFEKGGAGSASYVSGSDTVGLTVASISVSGDRLVVKYAGGSPESTVLEYVDGRLVGTAPDGKDITLSMRNMNTVTYHHFGGGTSIERYDSGASFRVIPCALPSGMAFDGWYSADGTLIDGDFTVTGNIDVYANAYTDGLVIENGVVTDYVGDSESVVIPTRHGGAPVHTVGASAFDGADILSVEIPEGITEISDAAFRGCVGLTYVKLPASLEWLGDEAFYNCTSFEKLTVPDGVTHIGRGCFGADMVAEELDNGETAVFSTNVSLSSISLPFVGGERDGDTAFLAYIFGASSPDDNWYDGDGREFTVGEENGIAHIFYYLPVSLSTVTVRGDGNIPDKAFFSCIYLEKINLEGWVEEIGDSAFENCFYADVEGISTVEVIGDRAFLNTSFDGTAFFMLKSIGELAFAYAPLTSIHFPETLESIGDGAFAHTAIESVVFPASLTYLGDNAFYGCNPLDRATFLGTEVPECGSDIFTVVDGDAVFYTDVLIIVPGTTDVGQPFEAYRSNVFLRDYASGIFPESVKSDTGYIISGNSLLGYIAPEGERLEVVDVPEGVMKIADFAFYNCGYIKEINLPEGFARIGKYAFYGCTSVSYLNMPSTIKEIDDYAFTGFFVGNRLTRLYFPEGFERIGEGAFMSSFNLRIVELPSTLKYVGYLAFGMANSLERISFAGDVPPAVGSYTDDKGEASTEIFQIVNSGKLTVFVPGGKAEAYRTAPGFSNVADYVRVKPEGGEVGTYGGGGFFIELDGSGTATVSVLVLADEDTSSMGGTKYVYDRAVGEYLINGTYIKIVTEKYGTLEGVYAESVRRMMLTVNGVSLLLTEPRLYYDGYNWTNFRLYEDGTGVFDMYGSFITPFKWSIEGDVFTLTIDGNNKLPENAELAGERDWIGVYDAEADRIDIEFMLNDYTTAFTADRSEILYATGEVTRLYGKYVAYTESGYAMLTLIADGMGGCQFYIGESLYPDCTYTVKDGVVTVVITILEVELTLDQNGRLVGGASLAGSDMLFVFEDECMDPTKMPD